MVKLIARVDTEIYKDNGLFCCDFLGDDTNVSDGSGYSIAAKTAEACAEAVKQYILNIFKNETNRK